MHQANGSTEDGPIVAALYDNGVDDANATADSMGAARILRIQNVNQKMFKPDAAAAGSS